MEGTDETENAEWENFERLVKPYLKGHESGCTDLDAGYPGGGLMEPSKHQDSKWTQMMSVSGSLSV